MKTTRGCLGALFCLGLLACEQTPLPTESTFDEVAAVARCQQTSTAATPEARKELSALVSAQAIHPEDCAEFAEMLEMIQETEAMLDDALEANPDYVQLTEEGE